MRDERNDGKEWKAERLKNGSNDVIKDKSNVGLKECYNTFSEQCGMNRMIKTKNQRKDKKRRSEGIMK